MSLMALASYAKRAEDACSSAFVPPKGLQKVAPDESLEDFDHDKLKQKLANGCELWAIRIPDGVRSLILRRSALAYRKTCSSNCGI